MLSNQMKEGIENVVNIDDKSQIDSKYLTEYILEWIYAGECNLPTDILKLVDIINLADEYLL